MWLYKATAFQEAQHLGLLFRGLGAAGPNLEVPVQVMLVALGFPRIIEAQVLAAVIILPCDLFYLVLGQPLIFPLMDNPGPIQTSHPVGRFLRRVSQYYRDQGETIGRRQVEQLPDTFHVPAVDAVGREAIQAQRPGRNDRRLGGERRIDARRDEVHHVVRKVRMPQGLRTGLHATVIHAVQKHTASPIGADLLHQGAVLDHDDGVALVVRGVRRPDACLQDLLNRGRRDLPVQEVAVNGPQARDGLESLIGGCPGAAVARGSVWARSRPPPNSAPCLRKDRRSSVRSFIVA